MLDPISTTGQKPREFKEEKVADVTGNVVHPSIEQHKRIMDIMSMNRHQRRAIAKSNGIAKIPGINRADLKLKDEKRKNANN